MSIFFIFFFFNDTATTEIYTLSLHDALPISRKSSSAGRPFPLSPPKRARNTPSKEAPVRSEEHTSELQSRFELVCRLLLEKKKEKCEVEPDSLLTGKGIASGMPLGAMIARDDLMTCPMGAHGSFFFFNDTATTEIYTLSLHDALPISAPV